MTVAPFFSVIIPTRERADRLRRALASVTAQTDQDYEIIVVDDGSSAGAAAEIAAHVAATPRAVLIRHHDSLGAPRARNRAAEMASGRMLALLDSDDSWAPTRLAAHRAAAGEAPRGVITYNIAQMIDAHGRLMSLSNDRPPDPKRLHRVSIAGSNFLGGCSSVCVDRQRFLAIGGFSPELPSCQDWDLWFRLAQAGSELRFVPEVLTLQDCGPHLRISNQRDRVLAGHATVMTAILNAEWSEADRHYIAAHHQRVRAWIEHSFGNDRKALAYALAALMRLRDAQSRAVARKYARRAVFGDRRLARFAA